MAFNITVLDKVGNILDWDMLDSEVSELWQVPKDPKYWCRPPEKSYCYDWNDFLGHCVFLLRAYDSSNKHTLHLTFSKSYWNLELGVLRLKSFKDTSMRFSCYCIGFQKNTYLRLKTYDDKVVFPFFDLRRTSKSNCQLFDLR